MPLIFVNEEFKVLFNGKGVVGNTFIESCARSCQPFLVARIYPERRVFSSRIAELIASYVQDLCLFIFCSACLMQANN